MDLVHPFLGRMMRRVRGAGNVVAEERFVRLDLVDAIQVLNGVVGHAGDQVPARLAFEGIDLRGVAEQVRLPLVRVAADEPVEILEAHVRSANWSNGPTWLAQNAGTLWSLPNHEVA